MKFKRLMSASLAGIMAVSSSLVCQISVGAEEAVTDRDLKTGSIGKFTLKANSSGGIDNPSFILDDQWSTPVPVKGYGSVEITYTCTHPENVANIYLIAFADAGSVTDGAIGWQSVPSGAYAKGKITLDLSGFQDKKYQQVLIQVQPAADKFAVGDEFDPGITITSAKLKAIDTREWVETELSVAGLPTTKDNQNIDIEVGTDKTIDIEKYSSEAQLVVYYTSGPDAGWGNVQVINSSTGWNKIGDFYSKGNGVKTSGAIDLAYLDGASKVTLQVNNGATITKVAVKDVKSSEPVLEAHDITVTQPKTGGTIEIDKETGKAKMGEVVTVTTSPANDYFAFDVVNVTGSDNSTVPYTKDKTDENKGTFTMPDMAVTVTGTTKFSYDLLGVDAAKAAQEATVKMPAKSSTTPDEVIAYFKAKAEAYAADFKEDLDAKNFVFDVNWDGEVTHTPATEDGTGSIEGTLTYKIAGDADWSGSCLVTVTLPKIAVTDAEKLAAAKAATEALLAEFKADNTTTAEVIKEAIIAAIDDEKVTVAIEGFKKEKDDTTKSVKISGTVVLTCGESVRIPFEFTIEQTDAEKLADAKKAAQEVVDAAKTAEDITKEAIEKAVNNKDVDVKVEYKITKEATTEAEGEATVTVTLTLGKESETITETFVIAKLKHSAPSEENVEKKDPTAIWEGSQALGNWDQQIDLPDEKIADLGSGVLIFELADCTEEAKLCVQLKDGNWPCLDGTEILTLENGQTEARIAVTAEALAATKGKGAAVKGAGVTVKKVSFISAADNFDKKVTVSANDDKAPSVSTVVTEIDDEGKMEQIAICAISEEAAKTCTSYKVTITREIDNKVFTVEKVTDCWKKAKYTNVNGEEVLVEAAEGDYCIVLDITGISGEWGALTIKITANNE